VSLCCGSFFCCVDTSLRIVSIIIRGKTLVNNAVRIQSEYVGKHLMVSFAASSYSYDNDLLRSGSGGLSLSI